MLEVTRNAITDFYPRSPCGERQPTHRQMPTITGFLSTLSLRRATGTAGHARPATEISIHALLAESDAVVFGATALAYHFYPRSPCGERHANLRRHCGNDNFYPRSPCGERLIVTVGLLMFSLISIHALLAESDVASNFKHPEPSEFLSTLSLRRATCAIPGVRRTVPISIHALLAESDHSAD